MVDEKFIIEVVLKARDEMGLALAKAAGQFSALDAATKNVNDHMAKFNRTTQNMRNELDKLTAHAEKTRRGIRSIGGEDIKISVDLDTKNFDEQTRRLNKSVETNVAELEKLRAKREELEQSRRKWEGLGRAPKFIDEDNKAIDEQIQKVDVLINRRKGLVQGAETRAFNFEKDKHEVNEFRKTIHDLDADLERTVTHMERSARSGHGIGSFVSEVKRLKQEMIATDKVSGDSVEERIALFQKRARDAIPTMRGFGNSVDRAGNSLRRFGRDSDNTGGRLARLNEAVHRNRESIAKFDNEIRGMRVLLLASQLQALVTVVDAAAGQLAALGGSAISAGAALGGALTAGAAQAIPIIGLLAATVFRLGKVFQAVQQQSKAQQSEATRGISQTNKQADVTDRLTGAQDTLREATRNVTEERRTALRALQDLILAEQRQRLGLEESQDKLRQLRSQGVTGFELRSAQLDVQENKLGLSRATVDRRRAQTAGVSGAPNVQAAERQLAQARRGLANASRDIGDVGQSARQAASRTLDFFKKQLTASELALFNRIVRIRALWKDTTRPITDILVNSFSLGVKRSEALLRNNGLIKAFTNLATVMASQFDRITKFFTSDKSIAFFTHQTDLARNNMKPLTDTFLNLVQAFMNIANAAAPVLHELVKDIRGWSESFLEITNNQKDMREFFEFGRRNFLVWVDLVKSIARTIKALIAPGGDLQSGAAASGMRSLIDLTERFNHAADWLNQHPMEVNKFFGKSEETWQVILDLAIKLGKIMLEMFDPTTAQAFSEIIVTLVPAFQFAAQAMAEISKAFAFIIQIPGINQLFVGAFGAGLLIRILEKFKGLLLGVFGEVTKVGATLAEWPGMITRSGIRVDVMTRNIRLGIIPAWAEATAAVEAYTVAVTEAGVVTGAGAGAVIAGGKRAGPTTRAERDAARAGRLTAAEEVAIAGGTGVVAKGGLGGLLRGGLSKVGAAGRAALPVAGVVAALEAATTPGGIRQRTRAAAGLGIIDPDQLRHFADSISLGIIRPLGILGSSAKETGLDKIKGRVKDTLGDLKSAEIKQSESETGRLANRLAKLSEEAKKFGDTELAKTLQRIANGARHASVEFGRFTTTLGRKVTFDRDDVRSGFWVNTFTGDLARLNRTGISSIKDLHQKLDSNLQDISRAFKRHTPSWTQAISLNIGAGIKAVQRAMKDGTISVKDGTAEIQRLAHRNMKLAANDMNKFSDEGRAAISRNFRRARNAVENNMSDATGITAKGTRIIRRLLAGELTAFGIDPKKAKDLSKITTDEDTAFLLAGHGAAFYSGGQATGGYVGKAGERGKDGVRTVLGRGEAVLNWGHQKLVEPALNAMYGFGLGDMFKRTDGFHAGGLGSPGFARGRPAEANFGGHPTNVVPGIKKLIALIESRWPGMMVSSTTDHSLRTTSGNISDHSTGHAVDMASGDYGLMNRVASWVKTSGLYRQIKQGIHNPNLAIANGVIQNPPGQYAGHTWTEHLNHIHLAIAGGLNAAAVRGGGGDVAKAIKRLRIVGPGANSALGKITQGALDIDRRAANRILRRLVRRADSVGAHADAKTGATATGSAGVARIIASVWRRSGLNRKTLLAAFEAALVESGMRNISFGDRDSLGVFQQRPSAGWGTPRQILNVTYAAEQFFNHARAKLPWGGSAGSLAQAVQVSAYPDRYDQQEGAARAWLERLGIRGFAAGGQIPGQLGNAVPIVAHAGEWILNKAQQAKASLMAGLSPDQFKGALGFAGGPTSFAGGGEPKKGKDSTTFELPNILPTDFAGFAKLIRDFFKNLKQLEHKSGNNFKDINSNLDILTREGGLLDSIGQALEDQLTNMRSLALRAQFRVKHGVVRRRFGELRAGERELDILQFQGSRLGGERRFVQRALRSLQPDINEARRGVTAEEQKKIKELRKDGLTDEDKKKLREIKKGGIDSEEQGILDDLLTQRRGLRLRRAAIRGQIAENLQTRFEAQGTLIEAKLTKALRGPLRRLAVSQAAQRVAEAFGRGGQINFIDEQIKAYRDQKPAILAALHRARRQKNTELADQLTEQLRDLNGTIAELVASKLQAQIEAMETVFARKSAFIDFRERIAAATGTLGLDRAIPGFGGTRRSVFQARGALLGQEIQQVQQLRFAAAQQRNVTALDALTNTLLDLQVQLQENTRALFLARVDEVNRKFQNLSGQATARGRIADLQAQLGLISSSDAKGQQVSQLQLIGSGLIEQATGLQQLLAQATLVGDEEQIASLQQAILDNNVAQLENTLAVKELNGQLTDTQSFSSTAWQWFRTAIFNGSGGLLPQFVMPQLAAVGIGGGGSSVTSSIVNNVSGAGGGGQVINVEVNEAGGQVDPVYLANTIAFNAKTPGT